MAKDRREAALEKTLSQRSAALRAARLKKRDPDVIRRLERAEAQALTALDTYLTSQGR